MPDADWVRYKQIRGKDLPEIVRLFQTAYRLTSVLKRDFYAAVGVYECPSDEANKVPERVLLKVYHTDPAGILPLGWLGRWMCRRETRFLALLAGVRGVPQVLGMHGPSGYVREYLSGCNLREYRKRSTPDADFFPQLERILHDVHARGMSHNDLSKPENVLVLEDGSPRLIDFQIAFAPRSLRWPLIGWVSHSLLRYLQGVDRYHLRKIHRRSRPEDFTSAELANARKKGWILHVHGHLVRRPYRAVRHFVLNRYLLRDDKSA